MKPQQVDFLRRLVADHPPRRPNRGVAAQAAEEEGIGRVQGSAVLYGAEDYQRAANTLKTRGYDVSAPPGAFRRSNAPRGGSEKTGAELVSQDLVAVIPINMGAVPGEGARFIVMTWQEAARLDHEAILLCENLESFILLDAYTWMHAFIKGRKVLALFRGAPGLLRTGPPAQLLRETSTPVLGFFDFDPCGLCMAASVPRLETLCLPPWEELRSAVVAQERLHLYSTQYHQCQAQLDGLPPGEISVLWKKMRLLAMGLNQEQFPY